MRAAYCADVAEFVDRSGQCSALKRRQKITAEQQTNVSMPDYLRSHFRESAYLPRPPNRRPSGSPDRKIFEALAADFLRRVDIAQVDEDRLGQQRLDAAEVERAESIPFGDDDERRGILAAGIGIAAVIEIVEIWRACSMPSGSKALTLAPASCSAVMIEIAGESRMSSVFGLKVRPSTAIVLLRTEPPQAASTLRAMARLR